MLLASLGFDCEFGSRVQQIEKIGDLISHSDSTTGCKCVCRYATRNILMSILLTSECKRVAP